MQQLSLGVRLQERALFANFHAGRNAQVSTTLQTWVRDATPRVISVFGGPATGKSHLLQACCAIRPGSAYLPIKALLGQGPGVLEGAERATLLAIDDLVTVAGRADWERAVFALYQEAETAQTPILFAGDTVAALLAIQLPDLRSRLRAAVALHLRPLQEVELRAAVRLQAQQRGLVLPDESLEFMLRHTPRHLASLCKLLDRLDEASLREQRRLTLPFVREVLQSVEKAD